jgi:hypothetical protein
MIKPHYLIHDPDYVSIRTCSPEVLHVNLGATTVHLSSEVARRLMCELYRALHEETRGDSMRESSRKLRLLPSVT